MFTVVTNTETRHLLPEHALGVGVVVNVACARSLRCSRSQCALVRQSMVIDGGFIGLTRQQHPDFAVVVRIHRHIGQRVLNVLQLLVRWQQGASATRQWTCSCCCSPGVSISVIIIGITGQFTAKLILTGDCGPGSGAGIVLQHVLCKCHATIGGAVRRGGDVVAVVHVHPQRSGWWRRPARWRWWRWWG